MTEAPPVVRFAPSPTGFLHVGSAQSALFNWLFARHTAGRFLLRIEDTDTERNRPELTDNILEMLEWLGLHWDGEPVHQSDRGERHRGGALDLMEHGAAYACDCTADDVATRTRAAAGKPGYDGYCRHRGLELSPGRALRFRSPTDGVTAWDDVVRGTVSFENASIEDFVLLRSDGRPTFLLANVVDDADMAISHVIRGEDHVNGTPKYLCLRSALGLSDPPTFAHLPLLVNESRKKLSKRRDDVSVADYQTAGYLPEAMVNYLSLLGWGPPDGVEVRPITEIVELFELQDVNAAPAFFDRKKLDHVNGEWIRALPAADFVARAEPFLTAGQPAVEALRSLAPLVQERVRVLTEVESYIDFLYLAEPVIDPTSWEKAMTRGRNVEAMLDAVTVAFQRCTWTAAEIRGAMEAAAVTAGLTNAEGNPQLSKAQTPVRVAVTGRSVGPPLFEALEQLGRERTLARLGAARRRLS